MQPERTDRLRLDRRGVVQFTAIVLLAIACARSPVLERLELLSYDLRHLLLDGARRDDALRPWVKPLPETGDVVLIAVDDRTVTAFKQRLPIARRRLAEFVRIAGRAGASVTLMDGYLVGQSEDPAEDEDLERALGENGRVVCALRPLRDGRSLFSNPRFGARLIGEASVLNRPGVDGVTRTAQLLARQSDAPVAGFALTGLIHHRRLKSADLPASAEAAGDRLTLGPGQPAVPLVGTGAMLLDFSLTRPMVPVVSLCDLPERLKNEPGLLRGKIALLGDTYAGTNDFKAVPVGPGTSTHVAGVYLHAFTLANLISSGPRVRAPFAADACVVLVLAALGIAAFLRLSERRSAAVLVALELALAAVCIVAFLVWGVWVAFIPPAGALAGVFAASIWMRLVAERNARRSCEILLSSYFSPAAAAGLEPADDPRAAERLFAARELLAPPGYEIVSRLGQGGMSVVFRAVQRTLGRTVALKFISPRLYRDDQARARFVREARLAGAILDEHVVAVFDSGESRGVPFIAMEFVDGESLRSLIERRERLPPPEAAGILKAALRGLAVIHDRGIVHRDIKSENIMISRDNQVKIADFGIAKSDIGDGFETMADIIMGTPAYIAPEIVRGERPTPASDIYSMGVVLYEMLTGKVPFEGDSASRILMKHVNEPVPDLAQAGFDLSRGFLALLRRMLEKQPVDRYATAADALAELGRLFDDTAVPAASSPRPSGSHATVSLSPSGAGTLRTSRKTASHTERSSRPTTG